MFLSLLYLLNTRLISDVVGYSFSSVKTSSNWNLVTMPAIVKSKIPKQSRMLKSVFSDSDCFASSRSESTYMTSYKARARFGSSSHSILFGVLGIRRIPLSIFLTGFFAGAVALNGVLLLVGASLTNLTSLGV